jgi:hypothetical protein
LWIKDIEKICKKFEIYFQNLADFMLPKNNPHHSLAFTAHSGNNLTTIIRCIF